MDDQGRLIIPGQFRKDGKPFVGSTFEETRALEERPELGEGNRHERRKAAALERRIKALEKRIEEASALSPEAAHQWPENGEAW